MKKILAIGMIVLLLLACSIGLVTAENQSMEYTAINAALSPVGGELVHHIPSGSVIYHSAGGITTVYTAEGKRVLKARDSEAAMVPAGFGSVPATKVHDVPNGSHFTIAPGKFYTDDRGWIAGNTTKTYAPDGTLVLTVIHEKRRAREETFATENQSEEYVVINAPITPTEGEGPNHVPPGSLIYHSNDGITTAYAPGGKIIWKARDSDAKILGMGGLMAVPWRNVTAHGPIPATKFIGVPSGSRTTHGPIKFYTEDRGWIVGNGSKGYGPDGKLLLICAREDRTRVVKTLTTENVGEKYLDKITNHVPPGSLVYHANDGITRVYAPDGKVIVKARDIDSKTLPMSGLMEVPWRNVTTSHGPLWATHISAVSAVPNCTHTYEQVKFYTEDRGWIVGNAVKSYGPDGTLLLIGTSEKRTTCEKTVELSKLGDSEFSGWLERTIDYVNTLDEFTAYWDCPSAPPSPNPDVSVLFFNAVQDYTDWGRIMQPILCWSTVNEGCQGETAEETPVTLRDTYEHENDKVFSEQNNWLDETIDFFKIILHWEGSDSDLDLTIIDPNGTVIEPGMPGVFYSGNDTYPEYYEIHNPQPGKWTFLIYGKNVTGEYENYTVTVFHPGALMYVKPTNWLINSGNTNTIFTVSEIGSINNLINVTFTASDLVEVDPGVAAARRAEMEARLEAEREGKYFSPENTSYKPLGSQKLNGNTIPASSFSFSLNNFNIAAGGSQNVTATLTIPPGTPAGKYSGTIKVTSGNGNNATIRVTFSPAMSDTKKGEKNKKEGIMKR
ncbi:MAG TPA: hypothetical protein C5S37_07410 [Methanophagales archaeon]|nr:hypothetical protein [Methanophagales archaeon]